MQPDAALYDEASGDATLTDEVRLLRAKLAALVRAGAGDSAILDVVDAIRRCVATERLRPGTGVASLGPPYAQSPIGPFAMRLEVVGPPDMLAGPGADPMTDPIDVSKVEPPAPSSSLDDEDSV